MVEKLAIQIFKRKLRSSLKDDQRSRMFVDYQHAQSVFIVFESSYSEKNPEIKRIIESLNADGKTVTAWGYVHKKHSMQSELLNFKILNQQDFDFLQRPKMQIVNQLRNLSFDLLIDLTTRPNLAVDYLILNTPASLKCGVRNKNLKLFDFTLDLSVLTESETIHNQENDYLNIYNQLIFYLKNIQTKDY